MNTSEAAGVAPVSDDTAALALHASSFRGTITISSTTFYGNHYRLTDGFAHEATARRQLRSDRRGRLSGARSQRDVSAYAGRTSGCSAGTQSGLCSSAWEHFRAGRQLHSTNVHEHASTHQQYQHQARHRSRALQQVTGLQKSNGLLLSRARLIHPELQVSRARRPCWREQLWVTWPAAHPARGDWHLPCGTCRCTCAAGGPVGRRHGGSRSGCMLKRRRRGQ